MDNESARKARIDLVIVMCAAKATLPCSRSAYREWARRLTIAARLILAMKPRGSLARLQRNRRCSRLAGEAIIDVLLVGHGVLQRARFNRQVHQIFEL